jgi:hypothetical protein
VVLDETPREVGDTEFGPKVTFKDNNCSLSLKLPNEEIGQSGFATRAND